jgi:hypothetical protein
LATLRPPNGLERATGRASASLPPIAPNNQTRRQPFSNDRYAESCCHFSQAALQTSFFARVAIP